MTENMIKVNDILRKTGFRSYDKFTPAEQTYINVYTCPGEYFQPVYTMEEYLNQNKKARDNSNRAVFIAAYNELTTNEDRRALIALFNRYLIISGNAFPVYVH